MYNNKLKKSLIAVLPLIVFFLCLPLVSVQAQDESAEKQEAPVMNYSKPSEYVIGGIEIEGIKYLDQEVLKQFSGLKVGETVDIPGEKITKAIEKYWNQGLFADVKIHATEFKGNKVYLKIYLKERPRLAGFEIEGVKNSEEKDLEEKLGLQRGSQVTESVLNNTTRVIKDYFVEKGFLNTKVHITQKRDSVFSNSVNLMIDVDKKEKIKVNNIKFMGNTVFTEGKLRRTMKEVKEKAWYNIFKPSRYTEDKLETDVKKLEKKYQELGYRDVEITVDSVYMFDEKTVNIRLDIYEGNQYFIRNISWVGNTKYDSRDLNRILKIEKGDPYDQNLLQDRLYMDEDAVTNVYLDHGYLFSNITPVEVNVENDSVDLEMRVVEGDQASVNEVNIDGNTKTNDHVIRRELRTRPGELFSKTKIKRSIRELANLGHFNPEKLDVKPMPDPASGTVDLNYKVQEKANDRLELSGGWGAGMLVGSIGLEFNNFSMRNILNKEAWRPLPTGDGQKLSLNARTNGKYYQSYSISFTEPWLGGTKPNSLNVSVYYSKYTGVSSAYSRSSMYGYGYGINNDQDVDKYMKTTGMSVGLGKRLEWPDDYFVLYNEVSYQRYGLKNWSSFRMENGNSNHFYYKTQLRRNSVDQLIYPRQGSEFSLGLQLTPPYSLISDRNYAELDDEKYRWIEYHKWTFKGVWYLNLIENLVLASKSRFGYLGYYNPDYGFSPFESFDLGGDGMRGYSYYGRDVIALRGYGDGALTPIRDNNKAGNIFNKYTMELRYPVALKEQATVYLLGFAEAGNSWYSLDSFNPFEVKRSAGIGLRAFLPMFGMLGIDWGYGFDNIHDQYGGIKEGDINGSQFHFVMGHTF